MLSTGFYNQEGLLKAQNYQKYTFHGNLQHSFNKWLTVGANTQFTYSIQDVFDSALIDIYRYGWPTENVKMKMIHIIFLLCITHIFFIHGIRFWI